MQNEELSTANREEVKERSIPKSILNRAKRHTRVLLDYGWSALKWLVVSLTIGLFCGCLGFALHFLVDHSAEIFSNLQWLLYLLPVLGLIIVGLYKLARIDPSTGTDDVFQAARSGRPINVLLAPVILITTALTHIAGGSSGREGAALQIGGSTALGIGRLLRFKKEDLKILALCGMSAVFGAAFGTPMAAAVFCAEVVNVGSMRSSAFMPCMISSFSGFIMAGLLGAEPLRLTVHETAFGTIPAIQAFLAGVLCAFLSLVLCYTLHHSKACFKKYLPNPFLRVAVGGLLVIAFTLIVGNRDYNGAGLNLIRLATENGSSRPYDFILKLLITAITLGSGFRGGEIIPTLTIGACFGAALGPVIGLDASVCALICMVAVFCGAVNCPLASILLGFEIANGASLALVAIACSVSFMLSGKSSLYTSQEFMFNKLERLVPEKLKGGNQQ